MTLHEGKFNDTVVERILESFKRSLKTPLAEMVIKLREMCQISGLRIENAVVKSTASPPYQHFNDFVSQGAIREQSRLGLDFVVEPIALEGFYEFRGEDSASQEV